MLDSDRVLPDEFSVGDWRIDGNGMTVARGRDVHALEPRAFKVLKHLAEHPGKLVTIDELMDQNWGGAIVTPNAVTRVIAGLRKALDDDARNPRYIETIPRTGYRLIAEVRPGATRRAPRRTVAVAIAAGAFVLAAIAWLFLGTTDNREPAVAVLPFSNLTGDQDLEYIGEGVADEVIVSLTRSDSIEVASPDRSLRIHERSQDLASTADDLGVSYIVDGSVRRNGGILRITARLVDPVRGVAIWSRTEEYEVFDLFAAQDAIAAGVQDALRAQGFDVIASALRRAGPDPAAYDLYLKARHIWHQRGSTPLQPAIDYLREAVTIDPEFAHGWGALAQAYVVYPSYSSKGYRTWHLAEDAARKAVELDPEIAEAYGVLAVFAYTRNEWISGERLFLEGLRRNPQSASLQYWYGEFLAIVGKQQESARRYAIAAHLDPTYLSPRNDIAFQHMNFHDYAGAAQRFESLWNDGYQTGLSWFGNFASAILLRDGDRARQWIERKSGDEVLDPLLHRLVDFTVDEQADPSIAEALYEFYAGRPDYPVFVWYAGQLGAPGYAMELLHDRAERAQIIELRALWGPAPDWAAVPEFRDLLERIGLIDYWENNGWGDVCRIAGERLICDAPELNPANLRSILTAPVGLDSS